MQSELLSLVLVAGIAHKNGDPAACVDSLLAAAFGSPGRTLSASEAREQLLAQSKLKQQLAGAAQSSAAPAAANEDVQAMPLARSLLLHYLLPRSPDCRST